MSDQPDIHRIARQMAVLEERMETTLAKTESAIDRLRADMARRDAEMGKRDAEMATEMAKRDAEMAKRDKDNTRWQIGLWVAAVVILGFLIRWPF